jgi:hypothetical protein
MAHTTGVSWQAAVCGHLMWPDSALPTEDSRSKTSHLSLEGDDGGKDANAANHGVNRRSSVTCKHAGMCPPSGNPPGLCLLQKKMYSFFSFSPFLLLLLPGTMAGVVPEVVTPCMVSGYRLASCPINSKHWHPSLPSLPPVLEAGNVPRNHDRRADADAWRCLHTAAKFYAR